MQNTCCIFSLTGGFSQLSIDNYLGLCFSWEVNIRTILLGISLEIYILSSGFIYDHNR